MLPENKISYQVRGACFEIAKTLGPGLLESVYECALAYELRKIGYDIKVQTPISVSYGDTILDIAFRTDLIINDTVIVEIKSVDCLRDIHFKQLLTYLKLTKLKLGLLINFNTTDIEKSIFRVVNKL